MVGRHALDELISSTQKHHSEMNLGFLADAIYSRPLTEREQLDLIQLIKLARAQQSNNLYFESAYQHLLHLYVLSGSRFPLLKLVDRQLRALADGRGGLLMISGVSGIGKTSLVLSFQERMQQLGAEFIVVHCSEQKNGAYDLWQEVVHSMMAQGSR